MALGIGILGLALALRAENPSLDKLERLASEWIKVRSEISRLEEEWSLQRSLLESMIKLQDQRVEPLEMRREELKQRIEKARLDTESQSSKNADLHGQLKEFETSVINLDKKLIELRPKLPPRLSVALDLAYRSIGSEATPPSERMQLTMTILNRCLQFNRCVTCGDEVVAIPGEKEKLMKTVYLGLTVGYAWDCLSGKTWLGHATAAGWKWEFCAEAAQALPAFVAAHDDKAEPGFVGLPAETARGK